MGNKPLSILPKFSFHYQVQNLVLSSLKKGGKSESTLIRVMSKHCRAERHLVGAVCVADPWLQCMLITSLLLLSCPCGHTYTWNAWHGDWRGQYQGQTTVHQQGMWLAMDTECQLHTDSDPPPRSPPSKCFASHSGAQITLPFVFRSF